MRANEPGITVGIESAIEGGSLSLYCKAVEIDAAIGDKGISRAEDILPILDHLLIRNSLSRGQIEKVVVSTGPGSFTGIKIGISTAMGLADGLGCPTVGISALEAMANAIENDGSILTALPIGRDFVAAQHFRIAAGKARPVSDPDLLTGLQFMEELTNSQSGIAIYSGLFQRFDAMVMNNVISVGPNLASLIVRADFGRKARKGIAPLFIDRKPLAIAD